MTILPVTVFAKSGFAVVTFERGENVLTETVNAAQCADYAARGWEALAAVASVDVPASAKGRA